jgi:hypothetical protein
MGFDDQRDPGHPDCLQEQPADDQRPLADATDQGAGDRRDEEQGGCQRQQPQPGVERPIAFRPELEDAIQRLPKPSS